MIDTVAKIMLLVVFGVLSFFVIREIYRESKRSKILFEENRDFKHHVLVVLSDINSQLWFIKRELMMMNVLKIHQVGKLDFHSNVEMFKDDVVDYWRAVGFENEKGVCPDVNRSE